MGQDQELSGCIWASLLEEHAKVVATEVSGGLGKAKKIVSITQEVSDTLGYSIWIYYYLEHFILHSLLCIHNIFLVGFPYVSSL
jgi:hypothetical protein